MPFEYFLFFIITLFTKAAQYLSSVCVKAWMEGGFFGYTGHTKKERRAPAAEVVPAFRVPKNGNRRPETDLPEEERKRKI